MGKCPVCRTEGTTHNSAPGLADVDEFECPRCGHFRLTGTVAVILQGLILRHIINTSRLSHALRVRYDAQRKPSLLRDTDLQPYQDDLSYIPPHQQLENFILWVGNNQRPSHEWVVVINHALAARVGAAIGSDDTELGLTWLVNEFAGEGLYSFRRGNAGREEYQLRPKGWERFGELSRRVINGRNGFMAMKFGDPELNHVLKECFQPAAARAGFILKPLNENPSAGLIDNQIRAAIRAARFVVADLSHDNNGAYFEAGFAEGLGVPVIYTCEAGKFEAKKTHFDTNHMHTVKWQATKLDEACEALTATIRNTLPVDATFDA